ncbi:thioredoxin fold domain-containing protein [Sulfurospirillum diekertiae]|uniref:Thioredoxin-like fold domain-containing protein n=1 Tax=Sulfurospirillum diekertiae TaxID=1854492 RepID=A0A1Y0HMI3_9BACT|nr:thioredoxin fold domain-containing protein [Sulfurospirillum diekertiae]ARU48433.1 hypothetical protein Sdiek1_1269 [Sulfurospirillum diekertiae]ASC93267.1 hypothetical protein Sdiek2_1248 [Sulfurospirillum diekertiae]
MYTLLRLFFVALMSMATLHAAFLDEESAKAVKEKKLILVNIVSENCPYCKQMTKEVFNNPTYRNKIDQKYVLVVIDQMDPALPDDLHTKYTPANAILSPTRHTILEGYTGYMDPTAFMAILDEAYKTEFQ